MGMAAAHSKVPVSATEVMTVRIATGLNAKANVRTAELVLGLINADAAMATKGCSVTNLSVQWHVPTTASVSELVHANAAARSGEGRCVRTQCVTD